MAKGTISTPERIPQENEGTIVSWFPGHLLGSGPRGRRVGGESIWFCLKVPPCDDSRLMPPLSHRSSTNAIHTILLMQEGSLRGSSNALPSGQIVPLPL